MCLAWSSHNLHSRPENVKSPAPAHTKKKIETKLSRSISRFFF